MKLYYAPGACSLADHIALHEAGLSFEHEKVDLKAKKTESGADFLGINPKGYVPALVLDGGEVLTENIAMLDWIAQQAQGLAPDGPLGRTHLLERLAFISTEIHKGFRPFFSGASDEEKAKANEMLTKRFGQVSDMMAGDYLFASGFTVADSYLFVMLLWAQKNGVAVPDRLAEFRERIKARPSVKTAMTHEGLLGNS